MLATVVVADPSFAAVTKQLATINYDVVAKIWELSTPNDFQLSTPTFLLPTKAAVIKALDKLDRDSSHTCTIQMDAEQAVIKNSEQNYLQIFGIKCE